MIHVTPVILCGGSGTRLWPLSRTGFPKQFLCLTGNESLFQQAAQRLAALGNICALRDWGHAKDYVRMQWLMLQQDQAEDFVIATGVQYSVRQFIEKTAAALGMQMRWDGVGVNEVGYWNDQAVIKIDPRYFRPTEVETLLGDPTKAKQKLGWVPEITLDQMIKEMTAYDLVEAKMHALLKKHGYDITVSVE
jgi:GDPmannose 4,6-dehydratase